MHALPKLRRAVSRMWSAAVAVARGARLPGSLLALLALGGLNAFLVCPGRAQTSPSPAPRVEPTQPGAPAQGAPDQPPPPGPGLVDEIQKMLPAPLQSWPSIGSPQETIENLNRRAKDAGDNLSRLSKQEVVSGRVKCPLAANGAPDCKSAANRLCAASGFKEGKSLDSDSAEDCPASVLLSDKSPPAPAECRVENFVIRALCQR